MCCHDGRALSCYRRSSSENYSYHSNLIRLSVLRATAVLLLALSVNHAHATKWCWRLYQSNALGIDDGEICPAGSYDVKLCGYDKATNASQFVSPARDCPPKSVTDNSVSTSTVTTKPRVMLIAGIEPGSVEPDNFVPRADIPVVDMQSDGEPSRFSRHVGKFIGTMGVFALIAAAVAIFRFSRAKIRTAVAGSWPVKPARPVDSPVVFGPADAAQDTHYIQALDELDSGEQERAAWARAIACAAGSNDVARSEYIKLRVAQLARR